MKQVDLNSCLEVLNKKPKWFFEEDDNAEKLRCFETIQKSGTPSLIYSLIKFLKNRNTEIRQKSAQTIICLFNQLKSQNNYTDSLKHLNLEISDLDYYAGKFDEKTYVALLGIASFNGSGYIREKAMLQLEKSKSAEGIKFILLRLGDWVLPVRQSADKAFQNFITPFYIDELLNQLPIIESLLGIKRINLAETHNSIFSFILLQAFSESFFLKIELLGDKARFIFYKKYLSAISLSKDRLIKVLQDRNFLIRLEALKYVGNIDGISENVFIKKVINDKSAKVRLTALYFMKTRYSEFENEIHFFLSDESTSIRELSRYILKPMFLSFAEIYRNRIKVGERLLGNLSGLAETGSIDDLPIFEQKIISTNSQTIIACLGAVNKLDSNKAMYHALKYIGHSVAKVRKKAIEILSKNYNNNILEKVREIYTNGNGDTKKAILKVYSKIGGWSIISDLLKAVNDENLDIQNLSWQLLEKWIAKATNLFTTPTQNDIEQAIYLLASFDKTKMTDHHLRLLKNIQFCL